MSGELDECESPSPPPPPNISNNRQQSDGGDWTCTSCSNVNFARRNACNRCSKERGPTCNKRKKLGQEIGKVAAEKSRGLFSADDWQCNKCGNVNWARRQQCNVCNAPKFGEVEERTGLGGGYNDRGVVEYKERNDSDDEYDEFGRKKKKKTKSTSSRDEDEEEEDNREYLEELRRRDLEERKKKEAPKQKIEKEDKDEEEEEDEEEEDDDGDLSKYDLSDWGADVAVKNDKKSTSRSRSRSPIGKNKY